MLDWTRAKEGDLSADGLRQRARVSSSRRWVQGTLGFGLVALFGWINFGPEAPIWSGEEFFAAAFYWTVPMLIIGVGVLVRVTAYPYEWVRSKAGFIEQSIRQQQEARAALERATDRGPDFDERVSGLLRLWFVRYPVAIAIALAMAYLYEHYPPESVAEAGLIVLPCVWAAWLARELVVVLIAIGAVLLLLGWLREVHLTVQGAIIIGALIIAGAIYSSRR